MFNWKGWSEPKAYFQDCTTKTMHSKWLSLNISYTVVDIKTVIMKKVLILDFCIIQCITIRFKLTYNLKKTKITKKFPKFKKNV